ncbi:MAG: nuclear transport factor 2 family protein [Thermoanaerobaculia bacterium]
MKALVSAIAAALLASACATSPSVTKPKSAEDQRLYAEIARMDKQMFDAFNAHDIDGVMALFDKDLEFYHDKGGLLRYQDAFDGMKSNFDKNNGLRRDLVPGTLEIYPINNYGAVEVGEHRFCHVENGKDDCGVFKFTHVWRKSGDEWKVTRVVSYDH